MAQVNISEATKKQLENIRDAEGHKSLDSVIKLLTERADHAETYKKLLDTNAANADSESQHSPQNNDENDSTGVVDSAIKYQDALNDLKEKYDNIDENNLKRLLSYAYSECNSITGAIRYVEGYIQGYNTREREEMRSKMDADNLTSVEDGVLFLQDEIAIDVEEENKDMLTKLVTQYNVPVSEAVASVIGNVDMNQLPSVTTIKTSPTMIPTSRDGEDDVFEQTPEYNSQTPVSESVKKNTVRNTESYGEPDESDRPGMLKVEFEDENEDEKNN